jgi:hypothetical protein
MKIIQCCSTLLLFITVFASCGGKVEESRKYVHLPPTMPDSVYDKLQDGDFIMRKGTGPLSFHIMNATKEDYSHCGIIVKEDGKWRVIHAMGGSVSKGDVDGLQMTDLTDFVAYAADSMLFIARATFQDSLGPKIRDKAYEYLASEAPFDHSFDLFEQDRIYCSELIFCILRDITGENQMNIRKKKDSYQLLFSTFFDEEKYAPIFHLKDLGN